AVRGDAESSWVVLAVRRAVVPLRPQPRTVEGGIGDGGVVARQEAVVVAVAAARDEHLRAVWTHHESNCFVRAVRRAVVALRPHPRPVDDVVADRRRVEAGRPTRTHACYEHPRAVRTDPDCAGSVETARGTLVVPHPESRPGGSVVGDRGVAGTELM